MLADKIENNWPITLSCNLAPRINVEDIQEPVDRKW